MPDRVLRLDRDLRHRAREIVGDPDAGAIKRQPERAGAKVAVANGSGDGVGCRVDLRQLRGAAEIAEHLGIKRPHLIHDWRRCHPDFPQPVVEPKGTLIWLRPEVEKSARATSRFQLQHHATAQLKHASTSRWASIYGPVGVT